jgi:hypothetical protein
MHPEMMRTVAVLQIAGWQAEAQARGRVRLMRQARKDRRRGHFPDPLAGVCVPDYVDASFRPSAPPSGHTSGPDGAGSAAPATAGGRGMAGRDAA